MEQIKFSPTAEKPENESAFEQVEGRKEALERALDSLQKTLEKRYENFPFHNPKHSEDVRSGAVKFLETIEGVDSSLVTSEDKEIAELVGLGHDLVQDADTRRDGAPLSMRVRHRGFGLEDISGRKTEGNERKSAEELLEELGTYKDKDGKNVFDVKEGSVLREKIMNAIAVTYPETDMELLKSSGFRDLKIFQQYLTPQSSVLDLAIATADLRGPLADEDFETFRRSGDAEFRELNVAISEEVAGGIEKIPQERREAIVKSIRNWKVTQISFANWQRWLFEESINGNVALQSAPKGREIMDALKNAYLPNMEKNIEGTKRVAEESQVLSAETEENFRQALEAVGYAI